MIKNLPSQTRFGITPKQISHAFNLVIVLLSSLVCTAQSEFIKDVNTTENPFVIEYSQLIRDGVGNIYFISRGTEVWTVNTNATPQIAYRLRTMRSISQLTVVGNTLFFVAEDGLGKELWKSNGTQATTKKVKEIRSGSKGSDPQHLTNINGVLYFAANDGTHGNELWKSDGTETGTALVKDINPGPIGSDPSSIADVNGMIYFSAHDGTSGFELWKTNATSSGTVKVKDIYPGTASSTPTLLTNVNGKLFFVAEDQATGRELWISDGTNAGTKLLKDIRPGAESSGMTNLTAMNNDLYFSADDGIHGYQLWKSNPTTSQMVTSFANEGLGDGAKLTYLTVVEGALYFTKYIAGENVIHRTNGTSEGTTVIHKSEIDLNPRYSVAGGEIYFFSYYFDQDQYRPFFRLMKINTTGTEGSIVRDFPFAEDWFGDQTPLFRPEMVSVNNQLYFYAILKDGQGYKMLRSDGTSSGTVVLKDTYVPTQSSNPENFTTFQGITYFTAAGDYPYYGTDVWRTDGTSEGTFMLARFNYLPDIEVSGNIVYFMGPNYDNNFELWKTDGSLNGTALLKRFDANSYFEIVGLVDVYGTLYFADSELGQLWKSNGTTASTVMLKDFEQIKYIGKGGGRAIFSVLNASGTDELWRSSGTPNSTAKLKSIKFTGGAQSNDTKRVTVNDLFYFFADDGVRGMELWRSDGTTSGTYMVKDLRANDGSEYDFYALTGFRDSLYFTGKTNDNTYSLFKSNGTSAGTSKVSDVPFTDQLVSTPNKLLMFIKKSEGSELWSTGGTAGSTMFIMDMGSFQFAGVSRVNVNDVAYFSWAESPALWRSDGTTCGTFVIDTPPNPFPLGLNGTNLLFGAYTPMYGKEPFRLSTLSLPASPCGETLAADRQSAASEIKVVDYGPNPFTQKVTLRVAAPSGTDHASITVKNFTGEIIHVDHNMPTNVDAAVGEHWPAGLYVVSVLINGKSETFRLVKK
jgi:ELWxxDGT repeat protein